jgi:hypothetical protein
MHIYIVDSANNRLSINWEGVRCDFCSGPATHVCIDDPSACSEPFERMVVCDDCYWVRVSGTVWIHEDDTYNE